MKIAAFLVSLRALEFLVGAACKAVPAGWFNWTTVDGTLSRITLVDEVVPQTVDEWKTRVHAWGLIAVTVLTTDCDPKALCYETGEPEFMTIDVDMLPEAEIPRVLLELVRPEREFLGQWDRFAIGVKLPFGWVEAGSDVWGAYADGLRRWAECQDAQKLLDDLGGLYYRPMSSEMMLDSEEFEIPAKIILEDLDYAFFPSAYNPAFAVGFKDGAITTFGIRAEPDEWKFDKSGAIRARLEALKASVVQTA